MEIIPKLKKDEMQKHETEQIQKQKQEYKLIGSQKKVSGHTMFSYNTRTGEIKKAAYNNKAELRLDGTVKLINRIDVEKDCIYRQALNVKNVKKVLRREGCEV